MWRTADPSTALRSGRDDKSEGGAFSREWLVDDRTAGPSTSLRFDRNDASFSERGLAFPDSRRDLRVFIL